MAAKHKPPHTAGNFLLHLDGSPDVSFVKSVEGGEYKANMTTEETGGSMYVQKNNTTIEINPFTVELAMAVSKPVLDWINLSWQRKYARRNGAWHIADQTFKTQFIREFFEALVLETTLPALDAESDNPAYLKLKIQPEYTKDTQKEGKKIQGVANTEERQWSPANFRFTLDDNALKGACDHISKVGELKIEQVVKSFYVGQERLPQVEPVKMKFPDVNFELPAAHAKPFIEWHKKMVIDGEPITSGGVNGTIEYMDHKCEKTLLSVNLYDLGISSAGIDKAEAGTDKMQMCKVALFCHRMELEFG